MQKIQDDILSYREMCDAEGVQTLQRGMNFRLGPTYSVILMSQRSNAPYVDKVHADGVTIEYEGHDVARRGHEHNPKADDQPEKLPSGRFTQNGLFAQAVIDFKSGRQPAELVKVYEKVFPGVWSLKGFFDLVDYKFVHDGKRHVFRYVLKLSDRIENKATQVNIEHTRLIPSEVKKEDIINYAKNLTKNYKITFNEAYDVIYKEVEKKNLLNIYKEIELPILPIVKAMGERGILIDQKYFEKLSKDYHKSLDSLTEKIYKLAGEEFNINSPKQLGEILFVKMGIKNSKKKNASGNFSTKIEILEELEEDNPIISLIMEYRELQKLLSTYIDVIPKMAGSDGRLHSKFIQNATTTGRFSSLDPNLQNLPVKTELGKKIRDGFVAVPGYKLCSLDYSQIELRTIAILSGDKKMTEIFKEGKDIHAGVASFVFGVPIDKVDSEMRRRAKVINFGIIYGMGVTALRKNLGKDVSRVEAQKFYDNYFNQFSGVRDYLEGVKAFAKKNSYTETLFGRKRYFKDINSRIPFLASMAERTAINAPVQGTAADIIKLAILFAWQDLKEANLLKDAYLILQIHDELVFEIKEEALEKAIPIIKNAMEKVLERSYLKSKTDIPIIVNYKVGDSLGDVK